MKNRQARINAAERPVRLARAKRVVVATLLLSLTFFIQGCTPGLGGVVEVGKAIGQEGYRFSVLTWNAEGFREDYGVPTVIVPRKERYGRVAQWMKETSTTPDIIAIQEVMLAKKYNLAPAAAEDWDMPWEIITAIRDETGVTYRVAYFVVEPSGQGFEPLLWNGLMLLYNPARIVHLPSPNSISTEEPVVQWDDTTHIGGYRRDSPPGNESIDAYKGMSSLVDVDGFAWLGSFVRSDNSWDLGPAYTRFSLVGAQDARFSTYQLHFASGDNKSSDSLRDFVTLTEQKFGGNDTYPPVMLGDFNIGHGDMVTETTNSPGGTFDGFEMAGYFGDDLMGVLAGRQAIQTTGVTQGRFTSRFPLVVKRVQILPNESLKDARGDHGGGPSTTWGDHVGIFVEFVPYLLGPGE